MRHLPRPAALLAVLGLMLATPAHGEDTITLLPTGAAQGVITASTRTSVTISPRGGQPRAIPVNQIKKVVFNDDTGETRSIRDGALAGQVEQAMQKLGQLNIAGITNKFLKQDMEFYRAYCLAKLALSGGDKAAAGRALTDFITQNADSYHLYEAAELLGDVSMAANAYDNAIRWYSAVATAEWPEYQLRGKVLLAGALVAKQDFAGAVKAYDEVIANPINNGEAIRQKTLAQIGKAYCTAQGGDTASAITALEGIIKDNDPQDTELFGRAYNALGAAQLKAGQNKEALFAYLFTDQLFFGNPEVHAEAVYHIANLWEQEQQADRANQYRRLLKERYGGSIWASK